MGWEIIAVQLLHSALSRAVRDRYISIKNIIAVANDISNNRPLLKFLNFQDIARALRVIQITCFVIQINTLLSLLGHLQKEKEIHLESERKRERTEKRQEGGRGTERGKEMVEELGREGEKEKERETAGVCAPLLLLFSAVVNLKKAASEF